MTIKEPSTSAEFEAMWRLNHAVFAHELRLHDEHENLSLEDKFHHKNIYRIAVDEEQCVVAMIAAHWQEPFSAVGHFGDMLQKMLIPAKTAEIRIFATIPEYRKRHVAIRLGATILRELFRRQFEMVVISGISSQRVLYEHIGFKVVGEPILIGEATFYPMIASLPEIMSSQKAFLRYCDE